MQASSGNLDAELGQHVLVSSAAKRDIRSTSASSSACAASARAASSPTTEAVSASRAAGYAGTLIDATDRDGGMPQRPASRPSDTATCGPSSHATRGRLDFVVRAVRTRPSHQNSSRPSAPASRRQPSSSVPVSPAVNPRSPAPEAKRPPPPPGPKNTPPPEKQKKKKYARSSKDLLNPYFIP